MKEYDFFVWSKRTSCLSEARCVKILSSSDARTRLEISGQWAKIPFMSKILDDPYKIWDIRSRIQKYKHKYKTKNQSKQAPQAGGCTRSNAIESYRPPLSIG